MTSNTNFSMLTKLVVEPCGWDPELGFQHQHYCQHSCHSGPFGFGHIFVCCGREVQTDDVRCSPRCQRPHNTDDMVAAPDCPYCGPPSHEADILGMLAAIEWWFHFFGLLPNSDEVKQKVAELRAHMACVINVDLKRKWKKFYQNADSMRVLRLREALQEECEKQKAAMIGASNTCSVGLQSRQLPISDVEARKWYQEEQESDDSALPQGRYALDEFLDFRKGALDFFTEGDSSRLRRDMIEHIREGLERFGWPPESEISDRRLLALFDREMFTNHILNVGSQRPDLVESDRQMLLYRGEQLVKASHGYWASVDEMAGSAPGLSDIWDASYETLQLRFGWLLESATSMFDPIFRWLGASNQQGFRFRANPIMTEVKPRAFGTPMGYFKQDGGSRSKFVSAIQLLRQFEEPDALGNMLFWSSKHVATFLLISDQLQVHEHDVTTPEELEEFVKQMVSTCKNRE